MLYRPVISFILACFLLLSCTVSDKSPEIVLKPEGEKVKIYLTANRDFEKRTYAAELLCITETTIYFDTKNFIYAVPIDAVTLVEVEGYDLSIRDRMTEKLKPYSRYPQCLSESQWQDLLDHYQQANVKEL
jgi:hypothetical protein